MNDDPDLEDLSDSDPADDDSWTSAGALESLQEGEWASGGQVERIEKCEDGDE